MKQVDSRNLDNLDAETLNAINEALCLRLEELFNLLEIEMSKSGRCYLGCCPIHGGNNPTGLNIYPEGYNMGGYWRCNTRKCHNHFAQNAIGFVRGVLSRKKYGWGGGDDRKATFHATLDFILKFIGKELNINYQNMDKKKFCSEVEMYAKPKKKEEKGFHRNKVRELLKIPPQIYLDRGYTGEILNKYDVGIPKTNDGIKLKDRIIVPVYSIPTNPEKDKLMLVGVQGRSIFKQCPKCKLYHGNQPCPSKAYEQLFVKWRNSEGFVCGNHLYNLWYAKKYIQETRTIILVEGPGDVWRLEQAGIHNSVALFGGNLTEQQEILIETSGATTVVILTDYDEPGIEAADAIKDKLKRYYNIVRPQLNTKDVGDMEVEEINATLLPVLKAAERRF